MSEIPQVKTIKQAIKVKEIFGLTRRIIKDASIIAVVNEMLECGWSSCTREEQARIREIIGGQDA